MERVSFSLVLDMVENKKGHTSVRRIRQSFLSHVTFSYFFGWWDKILVVAMDELNGEETSSSAIFGLLKLRA